MLFSQLEVFGLNVGNIRGQGYDNGANMRGVHCDVQLAFYKLIEEHFSHHVFVTTTICCLATKPVLRAKQCRSLVLLNVSARTFPLRHSAGL